MRTMWFLGLAALLFAASALPLAAQPVVSAKSGIISWVEGNVFLGDEPVEASLTRFPDIKENAVVRTEAGRVEVLLTPGVVMHVGENSSFRMITRRLIDTRLELISGSAVVNAVEIAKDTNVTVVCKDATITLAKAGHYRFDTDPATLKVYAGVASVQIGSEHVEVGAGKMLSLTGTLAVAEKFNKLDTDSLDNWARRRDELMAMANVSTARSATGAYTAYGSGSYGGYWGFNPYFGMYTYIPGSGRFCDPYYGYCYYSSAAVYRLYYQPPVYYNSGYNAAYGSPSYPTMGSTSTGYSGTMAASSSSVAASAPAAASAASSAASSAGTSSAGHGSGGGGGRR